MIGKDMDYTFGEVELTQVDMSNSLFDRPPPNSATNSHVRGFDAIDQPFIVRSFYGDLINILFSFSDKFYQGILID